MELMKRLDKEARERMARLKAIREKLHEITSQRQFAARLGVSYKRYQNMEGSGFPISRKMAKIIKNETPGIDTDYILDGETGGLTAGVLRKLRED